MSKHKHKKHKWRKRAKRDVPGPLVSYSSAFCPPWVECENDAVLEDLYLEPQGLYWNVEIGEGPEGWF